VPHQGDAGTVKAIPQRGRLGSLSLAQILIAELSFFAIIAAATQGLIPALVTTLIAGALLIVAFARRQNRWWLEHRALTRDHRRRSAARREFEAGPALAALRTIAPGLTVSDLAPRSSRPDLTRSSRPETDSPNDKPTGVARDEAGWFGVVTLDQPTPVPLDTLISALAATDQPGVTLELVTHTVPAPTPDLPPQSPAVASYRQLTEPTTPPPAFRESSISVRIDAKTLAESVLDHTADPAGAADLTAALTRKIATTLRRQGIAGQVLNAAELLAILARSCDTETTGTGKAPVEEWTHWRSTHLIHRTYWLASWPHAITEIGPLLTWASTAPAAQTSVALVMEASRGGTRRAGDGDIAIRAFIRLATRPDADLNSLDGVLREGVRRAGGELRALDGEHGPAAYVTAPTGGGAG
jgi:type VII secretion protein EccE